MDSPLRPGSLAVCRGWGLLWPRDPERTCEANGYLVPAPEDVMRVLYVGGRRADETGWLFCVVVRSEGPPPDFAGGPPMRWGWLPSWAATRFAPPGPLRRLAWDGRRYNLRAWLAYYGDEAGFRLWEAAPG